MSNASEKLVNGFGITSDIQVKNHKEAYRHWSSMLRRVYTPQTNVTSFAYADCSVCEEWRYFKNFVDWYNMQITGLKFELDKDLLYRKNKVYSPDRCVFVPREINSFLIRQHSKRGEFPIGVSYSQKHNSFRATICIDGVSQYLGSYPTAQSAFNTYKDEKEKQAKKLAYKWKDVIDPQAFAGLMSFKVYFND